MYRLTFSSRGENIKLHRISGFEPDLCEKAEDGHLFRRDFRAQGREAHYHMSYQDALTHLLQVVSLRICTVGDGQLG